MEPSNKLISWVISILALLGPVSYGLTGLYELSRLAYLNARTDHIVLASFPIKSVMFGVYPTLIPLVMSAVLYARLRHLRGWNSVFGFVHALGYTCGVLAWLSSTTFWQITLGTLFAISVVTLLFARMHQFQVGNEKGGEEPFPRTDDEIFTSKIQSGILISGLMVAVIMVFINAGNIAAKRQEYYWCSEKKVILGFYGATALLGYLVDGGSQLGSSFQILETKDVKEMYKCKPGPLRPAP